MKILAVVFLLALATLTRAAEPTATSFTGHYEIVKSPKTAFSLDVLQKGKSATIAFSASHMDGSGAAPDGDGEGQLNAKGELKFTWSDSFENAGTAILRRQGKSYVLSMEPTKVVETRALVFYGDIVLKRTSTKSQIDAR